MIVCSESHKLKDLSQCHGNAANRSNVAAIALAYTFLLQVMQVHEQHTASSCLLLQYSLHVEACSVHLLNNHPGHGHSQDRSDPEPVPSPVLALQTMESAIGEQAGIVHSVQHHGYRAFAQS
jgi:hypothetical protein